MKVANSAQMRRIDEVTIFERGIAGATLMDRAGKAVAREVMERFHPDSVAVVAGKGNNAGDGFVAARSLHRMGVPTTVFLLFGAEGLKGEALDAFKKLPEEISIERVEQAHELRERLIQYEVVIDAILGTGVKGPVEGRLAEMIQAVNACETNVLSIDIPSGLMSEAKQTGGPHVKANVTVTIGLPKLGIVLDPGARSAGIISIADIGFPRDLLEDATISVNLLTIESMAAALPARNPSGHKGSFGKVLILGGSEGMTGAAIMAARSASRSGAGLIYVAYPRALGAVIEGALLEPVKRPLAGRERWFTGAQAKAALAEAEKADAVAFGPGIGTRPATAAFAAEIFKGVKAPLVVDADGLNLLANDIGLLKQRPGPTILTPHPGEASRLLNKSVKEIEADRLEAFVEFAREHNAITVLKGAQTIVTSPDGQRFINPTGNSGLAKGGSGDILTGLMTGLLAQGCEPLVAAQLAVFLHGVAADLAASEIGVRAMIPGDLLDFFGKAFLFLEKKRT